MISKTVIKIIHSAVDSWFDRLKTRWLGNAPKKQISVSYKTTESIADHLTLPGLFDAASQAQGVKPNKDIREALVSIASTYLDSHKEKTKASIVNNVNAAVIDASKTNKKADIKSILHNEVIQAIGKASEDVKTIIESESNRAKNFGTLSAVQKISQGTGINDPTIAFLGPNDSHTCRSCLEMFFLEDELTPRVWKMSEVRSTYFKRGDSTPCVGGCHPNCRHSASVIMPGYGFKAGKLAYISPDHDEWKAQRGI
jgi:hypothetical protein